MTTAEIPLGFTQGAQKQCVSKFRTSIIRSWGEVIAVQNVNTNANTNFKSAMNLLRGCDVLIFGVLPLRLHAVVFCILSSTSAFKAYTYYAHQNYREPIINQLTASNAARFVKIDKR